MKILNNVREGMVDNLTAAIRKRSYRQFWFWWILPLAVIAGWRYPVLGYFLPLCMMTGMGIALFKGRYWCDWLCPRGVHGIFF